MNIATQTGELPTSFEPLEAPAHGRRRGVRDRRAATRRDPRRSGRRRRACESRAARDLPGRPPFAILGHPYGASADGTSASRHLHGMLRGPPPPARRPPRLQATRGPSGVRLGVRDVSRRVAPAESRLPAHGLLGGVPGDLLRPGIGRDRTDLRRPFGGSCLPVDASRRRCRGEGDPARRRPGRRRRGHARVRRGGRDRIPGPDLRTYSAGS